MMANRPSFSCLLLALLGGLLVAGCVSQPSPERLDQRLLTWSRDSLLCWIGHPLLDKRAHHALYRPRNGDCVAVDPLRHGAGDYYSDESCHHLVHFQPARYLDFCREAVPHPPNGRLGNPAAWPEHAEAWTLWPATRLPMSVLALDRHAQPYMTRREYRRHPPRVAGTAPCRLEMRIYSRRPDQTGPALLLLHGGKWQYRSAGFLLAEAEIPLYTEQGFIIFLPAYRLIDGTDGNPECQGASWQDQVDDAEAALHWITQHGAEFSAQPGPVALIGGSSGAHLAMHLITRQPSRIRRALLLYPAIDFADFLTQSRAGYTPHRASVATIEQLFNTAFTDLRADSAEIVANSFPPLIARAPEHYPPLFILHGMRDRLLPPRQSVRLCNALSGDPEHGPAREDGGDPTLGIYSRRYDCDARGSQLHLFAEGQHILEACMARIKCRAGGPASRQAIAETLSTAARWLGAE